MHLKQNAFRLACISLLDKYFNSKVSSLQRNLQQRNRFAAISSAIPKSRSADNENVTNWKVSEKACWDCWCRSVRNETKKSGARCLECVGTRTKCNCSNCCSRENCQKSRRTFSRSLKSFLAVLKVNFSSRFSLSSWNSLNTNL